MLDMWQNKACRKLDMLLSGFKRKSKLFEAIITVHAEPGDVPPGYLLPMNYHKGGHQRTTDLHTNLSTFGNLPFPTLARSNAMGL